MLLTQLREQVLEANLELARRGLAIYTFGNASGISREDGLVVIKPSGVPYETMRPEDLVITDLSGRVVEGSLKPSSDLATHLVLYRAFTAIGGVVHTHSRYATAWAQARRDIPCLGTTHADYFYGPVPVTAPLSDIRIAGEYEANTGHAIVERIGAADPMQVPAALVASHGPFCWGTSATDAAHNAVLLEEVAHMAWLSAALAEPVAIQQALLDRHYLRKHGANATYGQR
ncbi:MAG: L-ribulose-5-phosphate 4-epimerase [bacterium]|jgi:L-ribulose-5-phosphate 4-epimerase